MVAAIDTGGAFSKRRDFGAWLGRERPLDNGQQQTLVRLCPNPGALSCEDEFEANMAVEIVNYNGYRLEVVPVGKLESVHLPSRLNLGVA
jgi:hypothetical protein